MIWKNLVAVICFLVMFPSYVLAEGGVEAWVRSYGSWDNDYATTLVVDSAGNVYVSGWSWGTAYTTVKYDINGNLLWTGRYNGALAVDLSGNLYVTGGSGTVKYDTNGNELWVRGETGSAIAVDSSGNVYITGNVGTTKYDTNGNALWFSGETGRAIAVDSSGNASITGATGTIKYDTSGSVLWVQSGDGSKIAIDGADNIIVGGNVYNSDGITDYMTIKYAPSGNLVWINTYNGPENFYDNFANLTVDSFGNVYVTGTSFSLAAGDYTTIKYAPNGNEIWVRRYSNGLCTAMSIDSSGNIYITGGSSNLSQSIDYATVKYDTNGNELWVKRYGNPSNYTDKAEAVGVDSAGNVYVTGSSYNGGSFDYVTIKYRSDSQGPIITMNEPQPQTIWQSNGEMTNVTISGIVADDISGVASASFVVNDEYNEIEPSGSIPLDFVGNFYLNIPLAANVRGSDSDGRIYTIQITAMDKVGNISSSSKTIIVAHDNRAH